MSLLHNILARIFIFSQTLNRQTNQKNRPGLINIGKLSNVKPSKIVSALA